MHAAAMNENDRHVLTIATERFERRLAEETGKLRVDMGQIRSEVIQLRSDVKADLATMKVDIIKWSFAFWLAQIATIATLFLRAT